MATRHDIPRLGATVRVIARHSQRPARAGAVQLPLPSAPDIYASSMPTFFSDRFAVDPAAPEKYGAFNVFIITDFGQPPKSFRVTPRVTSGAQLRSSLTDQGSIHIPDSSNGVQFSFDHRQKILRRSRSISARFARRIPSRRFIILSDSFRR
jgi:hypothetical protein